MLPGMVMETPGLGRLVKPVDALTLQTALLGMLEK